MGFNPAQAMIHTDLSTKEILAKVADHIIQKNPAVHPHLQPYIKQNGIGFTATQGFINVDFKQFYPHAKNGNAAFAVCKIRVPWDSPIGLLVNGKVKVWFNKECVFSSLDGDARAENGYSVRLIDAVKAVTTIDNAWYSVINARKDEENELIIEGICEEEGFAFDFNLSHTNNLTVWATDYLIWTREESPLSDLEGEEGIAVSALYEDTLTAEQDFFINQYYSYPKVEAEGTNFDFNTLYEDGEIAFAYTEAVHDTNITFTAYAPLRIMCNGEYVAELLSGNTTVHLKNGDRLLVKCQKKNGKWGFSVESKKGLGLPFVKMSEVRDLKFLFCGSFNSQSLYTRLGPEYKQEFSRPYVNEKGEMVYWRFFPEDTYLRAYLNSCYYGQWFYAGMLCIYGLLMTANTLDVEHYDEFFYNAMHQMAEYADYVRLDKKRYGSAAFMPYSMNMRALDNIGTMGCNFAEAYFKSRDNVFIPILERLRKGIDQVVPRFDDGTFCRIYSNTMWADDLYMSCPFLVRLARYTEDDSYFDEAAKQVKGFYNRLYMPEEKIFSHIYFIKENTANRIPWGRANGWIAYAISEILLYMPEEHANREFIVSLYREFMEGVCAWQHESGLWHQILNRPATYLETSCTAMFMIALIRGVRMGWIDKAYTDVVMRAWKGLKTYCLDQNGSIYGTCMGSSCSMEEKYYERIPTVVDDDHGTGVMLVAINELIMLEELGKRRLK